MIFSGRTAKCGLCAHPSHIPRRCTARPAWEGASLSGSPNAGTGFKEGKSGRFFSRVVDLD
jgi:hypothetical protein